MNVDGFIVRQNVARAAASSQLDVAYLASLSSDSVPALAAAYQDGSLPGTTRDAVGAALVCRGQVSPVRGNQNWRSFTLSAWQADQAMGQVQTRLDTYQVLDDEWPTQVQTPLGEKYDCVGTGMN